MDKSQNSHGTVYSYIRLGCHCAECRYAWASYMREYRARMNMPEPLVIASRDAKQAITDGNAKRRENEIKRAIDKQNQQDTNRDSAGEISRLSMAEWATARRRYGIGATDPGIF